MTDANAPSWKTSPRCDEAQLAMLTANLAVTYEGKER